MGKLRGEISLPSWESRTDSQTLHGALATCQDVIFESEFCMQKDPSGGYHTEVFN